MQSLNKTKQKLFPMMCAVLVLFLSLMIPMKPVFAAEGFGGTSETVSNSFSYVEWGFYDIAFDDKFLADDSSSDYYAKEQLKRKGHIICIPENHSYKI